MGSEPLACQSDCCGRPHPTLVPGAGVAFQEHTRNALTVSNSSGRTITSLEVSLPWQTLRFEPIVDGDVVTQSFQIRFEVQFEISGQLADGIPIRSSQG